MRLLDVDVRHANSMLTETQLSTLRSANPAAMCDTWFNTKSNSISLDPLIYSRSDILNRAVVGIGPRVRLLDHDQIVAFVGVLYSIPYIAPTSHLVLWIEAVK